MTEFVWEEPEWIKPFGLSVWHEFSGLARKVGSVNLGQGFPGWHPQDFIIEAVEQAVQGRTPNITPASAALIHQYARPSGHPRLSAAVAKLYSGLIGRQLNPDTQIQITAGASGGLFSTILGIVSPGDEVIVLGPWFDIYGGGIARAGAKMVEVQLKVKEASTSASGYYLDLNDLENAITENTKVVIINTPHNPTGKVFTEHELAEIAKVIQKHKRIVVVMDEVYEFITYSGTSMARMCTLPGMWDRTITISSAAKTFSVTGWKIGWVYGNETLISAVARCHQFAAFCIPTPLQEAMGVVLETILQSHNPLEHPFLINLKESYQQKRTFLVNSLKEAGLSPLLPDGTYFVVVDISEIEMEPHWGTDTNNSITGLYFDRKDWNFCRWLTTEHKLTAIPCSAFFSDSEGAPPTNFVRFAFCKSEAELEAARKILLSLQPFFLKKK